MSTEIENLAPIDDVSQTFESFENIFYQELHSRYLEKIQDRVNSCEVKQLNPFREGKKLLVLDIDWTIFDNGGVPLSFSKMEFMESTKHKRSARPGLEHLLRNCYEEYDIGIWSAAHMKYITFVIELLKLDSSEDFKIAFCMDFEATMLVRSEQDSLNLKGKSKRTKPLGVIWGKFPQFSPKNTIIVDDKASNFLLNKQSGYHIKPFAARRGTASLDDRELYLLANYLKCIANHDDFSLLNHPSWWPQKYAIADIAEKRPQPPHDPLEDYSSVPTKLKRLDDTEEETTTSIIGEINN